MTDPQPKTSRPVLAWLVTIYLCILAMILLGGLTRLTESGLSIVKWQPVTGIIPPLTEADWQARFADYKALTGQSQILFPDLTLDQFKPLFLWEYSHRLTGRLTGFIVAIPFIIFLIRRQLRPRLALKIIAAFIFGGLQGGVGWAMVATGLQPDAAHVSPYALAAHLGLALALMSFLVWIILDELPPRHRATAPRWLRRATLLFLLLLALQIFYGALTAGFRAGHIYTTFPLMNGYVLPPGIAAPALPDALLTNPIAIQWTHRALAWALGLHALVIWLRARNHGLVNQTRHRVNLIVMLTLLQFALGILTLLLHVPIALAAAHQLNAALLLTATLALHHSLRPRGTVR